MTDIPNLILASLEYNGPQTVEEIAARFNEDQTKIRNGIFKLRAKGLVKNMTKARSRNMKYGLVKRSGKPFVFVLPLVG